MYFICWLLAAFYIVIPTYVLHGNCGNFCFWTENQTLSFRKRKLR